MSRIGILKMKKKAQKISKIDKLFLEAQKKLNNSSCSVKKMKEYLFKKGANKKEIDEIILKLKKYSFLDEEEIIKNVISYCNAKHYGYNKIISMLKQREISVSLINKVIKDETRELEESKNMQNRLKKRYKNKNTVNLKRSVYLSLIRYGFDENIASIRAGEVFNSPQVELNMLKLEYSKIKLSKKGKDKIVKALLNKGYLLSDIKKVIEESQNEMDNSK